MIESKKNLRGCKEISVTNWAQPLNDNFIGHNMANFKQHLFYGVSASLTGSLLGYFKFGLNEIQSGAAFILGILGSLAPDLDHDESLPGKMFFEISGVIVPIALLPYVLKYYGEKFEIEHFILFFFASYLLVRYLLFYLFARLTVHRGIFHSLPAVFIAGEIVFLSFPHFPLQQRITVSAIVMAGYLSHLIADECYSIDWAGNEIKRSFGTAVDLGHLGEYSTWIAYAVLAFLGWTIGQNLVVK